MSRIEWKSIEDKYEAIGYLAKPGVIETIEATVPEDKLDKFKEEYIRKIFGRVSICDKTKK